MERWKLLYILLGLASGVLALGYGLTTNASPVLVGFAALLGIALFFIVIRPTAYSAVMAGLGSLAVVSGGYLYLVIGQAIGGLLVVVGLAGLARGVQVRRTMADDWQPFDILRDDCQKVREDGKKYAKTEEESSVGRSCAFRENAVY